MSPGEAAVTRSASCRQSISLYELNVIIIDQFWSFSIKESRYSNLTIKVTTKQKQRDLKINEEMF